jgi:polyvinyl alcohol dehydrogenase (cytochrome)
VLRQRSPEAVSEFLTGRSLGGDVTGSTAGRCSAPAPLRVAPETLAWTGWSPTSSNARAQTAERAGLTAAEVPKLTLKWAFGFPDSTSAWSQPTVAGERLFVGSQNGTVYALDARSGCIIWTFTAQSGVRTAPVFGARPDGPGYTVYFGDTGANVYALDAETGLPRWTRRVHDHPFARVTGTPTLDGERLYVPISSLEETAANQTGYQCCTFRGSVAALSPATGEVIWPIYFVPPAAIVGTTDAGTPLWAPSGVAVWSSPTVDSKRQLLYVTTGNTYSGTAAEPMTDAVMALDPRTGARKWSKQLTVGDVFGCKAGAANCLEKAGPDFDFGTPAVLVTTREGQDLILLGQKSGMAYAVDPDREGELVWQYRAGQGSIWGGIQWGIAADGDTVFLPVSDIRTPSAR